MWYWICQVRVAKKPVQENQEKSPCAGAPNICTVSQAKPWKPNSASEWSLARVATRPGCFLRNRIRDHWALLAPSESELSPFPCFPTQNLTCEPMVARSQSSSGNCPRHTTTKPLPADGHTTLRALWHDCMRDYCFPPRPMLAAAAVVAQGWNV